MVNSIASNRTVNKNRNKNFIVGCTAFSNNISSCDLILWTPSGISINQMERNEHFMDTFKSKVDNFIHDNFIPELKNRKLEYLNGSSVRDKSTLFCMWKRLACGVVRTCGSDECMTELFHYDCVTLKRKPKQKWYSLECSMWYSYFFTLHFKTMLGYYDFHTLVVLIFTCS